jgi:diadenosine tetraphosphate (Ap4A) HIT family hydrolase
MALTTIHDLVERCRASALPAAIAKVPSGWVIMGERQVLPGYCLLLPDPVVPHLNALAPEARTQFLFDMALIGDVLLVITAAARVNYAIYGNVDPALHAHIFPRDSAEPESTRTAQPWAMDWNAAPLYSDALHGDFKRRVGAELRKHYASR